MDEKITDSPGFSVPAPARHEAAKEPTSELIDPPTFEAVGPPVGPPTETTPTPAGLPPPSASWWKPALIGAIVGALVAAAVMGGIVAALDDNAGTTAPFTNRPSGSLGRDDALDIAGVLRAVGPGVVSINIAAGFGGEGAGSGMVIDEDGYVLTNAHVVRGAQRITVSLADGREEPADLVASILSRDVALLKLRDPGDLQRVTLGDSSDLQVGDELVAVGNALNLGETPSVTTGIVSALNRSLTAENGVQLENLIQTDAAINPGNSGGPLVNTAGEVIGVNTAIAGGAENIGFALAIDTIEPLLEDLRAGRGEVQGGPFLGLSSADVSAVPPAIRDRLNLETDDGAFVQQVLRGSGAEAAGIRAGDVIVAIDGTDVEGAADVVRIIQSKRPGDEVQVTIERDGEQRTVKARVGSRETG